VAGSLAIEGAPIIWVADHRRYHAYADRDGDPHSPWRYGPTTTGIAKGLLFAHIGWLFRVNRPTATGSHPTCSPAVTSAWWTGFAGAGCVSASHPTDSGRNSRVFPLQGNVPTQGVPNK
jgi:hypothetical protein